MVEEKVKADEKRSEKRRPRRKKIQYDLKCPLCESGVSVVTYKEIYIRTGENP